MTNAEMLTRLSKMSTHALRKNAKAAEETVIHWKGLAAGELDVKPECPFCAMYDYNCELCALGVTSLRPTCAAAFHNWQIAFARASHRHARRPLASKPVRAAAKKMLAHVRRVGRIIGKALEGRERKATR